MHFKKKILQSNHLNVNIQCDSGDQISCAVKSNWQITMTEWTNTFHISYIPITLGNSEPDVRGGKQNY